MKFSVSIKIGIRQADSFASQNWYDVITVMFIKTEKPKISMLKTPVINNIFNYETRHVYRAIRGKRAF